MALKKSLPVDNFGINAEYWRITKIPMLDPHNLNGIIALSGYRDVEAREGGMNPIPQAWYEIQIPKEKFIEMMNEPVTDGNTRYGELASAFYSYIKEYDFGGTYDENGVYTPDLIFSDAEDI